MLARKARSSGLATEPYSPTQVAPAAICSKRSMSSSGTWMTTAFQRSGCWVISTPISRPPLEPPMMPRRRGEVTLAGDQVLATAAKSS